MGDWRGVLMGVSRERGLNMQTTHFWCVCGGGVHRNVWWRWLQSEIGDSSLSLLGRRGWRRGHGTHLLLLSHFTHAWKKAGKPEKRPPLGMREGWPQTGGRKQCVSVCECVSVGMEGGGGLIDRDDEVARMAATVWIMSDMESRHYGSWGKAACDRLTARALSPQIWHERRKKKKQGKRLWMCAHTLFIC